jgi:hypothetical protein
MSYARGAQNVSPPLGKPNDVLEAWGIHLSGLVRDGLGPTSMKTRSQLWGALMLSFASWPWNNLSHPKILKLFPNRLKFILNF